MKTACYCEIDFDGLVTGLAIRALDGEITEISFGCPAPRVPNSLSIRRGRPSDPATAYSGTFDADCVPDGGGVIEEARRQVAEYAIGVRRVFDVPFRFSGTEFQMKVWNTLLRIPYGETRSYSEIARLAGNPAACRAAGGAIRRNPVSIIVPCHRVIGSDGSLTGFGGGLPLKEKLLRIERLHALRSGGMFNREGADGAS
jgi:O-6-methylguanine DNA methyltransferase